MKYNNLKVKILKQILDLALEKKRNITNMRFIFLVIQDKTVSRGGGGEQKNKIFHPPF